MHCLFRIVHSNPHCCKWNACTICRKSFYISKNHFHEFIYTFWILDEIHMNRSFLASHTISSTTNTINYFSISTPIWWSNKSFSRRISIFPSSNCNSERKKSANRETTMSFFNWFPHRLCVANQVTPIRNLNALQLRNLWIIYFSCVFHLNADKIQ